MALFSKNKKTVAKANEAGSAGTNTPVSFVHLIKKPRITEKAGIASESNVYTFEVDKNATKGKVKHAIAEMYKVSPVKVNIVNLHARKVFVRGKSGTQAGVKKALVFLKKGDKIDIA